MNLRNSAIIFWIVTFTTVCAVCQQRVPGQGPLISVGEALQRRNISLTKPALVNALRNADPFIRSAAAHKLAQDGAKDVIPLLTDALASERIPKVRVGIADALAHLGAEQGFRSLDEMCLDRTAGNTVRLDAARAIFAAGREACRSVLTDLMAERSEERDAIEGRIGALSILPDFVRSGLSQEDLKTVTDLAVEALMAKDPGERVAASDALRFSGQTRAVPQLTNAIAIENDEAARVSMEIALKALKKK